MAFWQRIDKWAAKRDVKNLIQSLDHSDRACRRRAAAALGGIGDPRGVEPLVTLLLRETDIEVRDAVRIAIARLIENAAVAPGTHERAAAVLREAEPPRPPAPPRPKSAAEKDIPIWRPEDEHELAFANELCHDCGAPLYECRKCRARFHDTAACNTFAPARGTCRGP